MKSYHFARLLTLSLFFITSFSLVAMEKPAEKSKEDQLWDAITEKELAKVQSLIQVDPTDTKPLDINHRYAHSANQTALMHAIQIGDPRAIRFIAQVPGLDVTIQDDNGWSALGWSIFSDSTVSLQTLLQFGKQFVPPLDLNERCQNGRTALNHAVERGNVEQVKLLCNEEEVDPNQPTLSEWFSPLHNAIRGRDKKGLLMIRMLVDKGAHLEYCRTRSGLTPLGSCRFIVFCKKLGISLRIVFLHY